MKLRAMISENALATIGSTRAQIVFIIPSDRISRKLGTSPPEKNIVNTTRKVQKFR